MFMDADIEILLYLALLMFLGIGLAGILYAFIYLI